jgi:hypothetical protein
MAGRLMGGEAGFAEGKRGVLPPRQSRATREHRSALRVEEVRNKRSRCNKHYVLESEHNAQIP